MASSGLVVSMLSSPAAADDNAAGALPQVDVKALTASARAALETSPVVSSPTDAAWSFDVPKFTVKKNPPPPPVRPAPQVQPQRSQAASRSQERSPAPAAAPTRAAVPQAVAGNAVLEIASRYVGVPYVHGGASPSGFDCSGFTQYVYRQLGISLPRTSGGQKAAGTIVSRAEAKPGDIIWSPGHVGIYAGGNQQIDAPRPGKTVQFRAIWQKNPVFVRVG